MSEMVEQFIDEMIVRHESRYLIFRWVEGTANNLRDYVIENDWMEGIANLIYDFSPFTPGNVEEVIEERLGVTVDGLYVWDFLHDKIRLVSNTYSEDVQELISIAETFWLYNEALALGFRDLDFEVRIPDPMRAPEITIKPAFIYEPDASFLQWQHAHHFNVPICWKRILLERVKIEYRFAHPTTPLLPAYICGTCNLDMLLMYFYDELVVRENPRDQLQWSGNIYALSVSLTGWTAYGRLEIMIPNEPIRPQNLIVYIRHGRSVLNSDRELITDQNTLQSIYARLNHEQPVNYLVPAKTILWDLTLDRLQDVTADRENVTPFDSDNSVAPTGLEVTRRELTNFLNEHANLAYMQFEVFPVVDVLSDEQEMIGVGVEAVTGLECCVPLPLTVTQMYDDDEPVPTTVQDALLGRIMEEQMSPIGRWLWDFQHDELKQVTTEDQNGKLYDVEQRFWFRHFRRDGNVESGSSATTDAVAA